LKTAIYSVAKFFAIAVPLKSSPFSGKKNPLINYIRNQLYGFFFFFFLSSTALGGLWLPSQLASMYFVPVPSLSIYQSSFVLHYPSHVGTTPS
jgi:hypothetical protein